MYLSGDENDAAVHEKPLVVEQRKLLLFRRHVVVAVDQGGGVVARKAVVGELGEAVVALAGAEA